jgi:hypothetical protein
MKEAAIKSVAKAAGERIAGSGPGPLRAAVAAAVIGAGAAVLTYKVLRSNSSSEE